MAAVGRAAVDLATLLQHGVGGVRLWRAAQAANDPTPPHAAAVTTGFAALDAALPGGGWMPGLVHEILLPPLVRAEWQLLAPGCVALTAGTAAAPPLGYGVAVAPPWWPFAPGLQALGLPLQRWLWVRGTELLPSLWAAEQALRCAEVAVVVLWAEGVSAAAVRRLQALAAAQGRWFFWVHAQPPARWAGSPAAVRLGLQAHGSGDLIVQVLKRRGPVLLQPLRLPRGPSGPPAGTCPQTRSN